MSKANDGPAFPTDGEYAGFQSGMSLRDWFAGMSLARLVNEEKRSPTAVAILAYQIADAMLAERSKE